LFWRRAFCDWRTHCIFACPFKEEQSSCFCEAALLEDELLEELTELDVDDDETLDDTLELLLDDELEEVSARAVAVSEKATAPIVHTERNFLMKRWGN
jgi:hypothetical protein